MRKALFFISFILFTVSTFSQNFKPENYIVFELGGSGNIVSLNYEISLFQKVKHVLLPKVGLSYFPMYVNGETAIGTFSCPLGIKYLYQLKESNHHIETGVENVFSLSADNKSYEKTEYEYHYTFTPSLGYRFEKQEPKTMMYYIGYSPRIYQLRVPLHGSSLKYQHYIKVGIGYKF